MEIKDVTLVKARPRATDTVKTATKLHHSGEWKDFLGDGYEGWVHRVYKPIDEKTLRGFAYKEYKKDGEAEKALDAWVRLRKAGLPVPSTFRLVFEGDKPKGILMTDLTRGGRDLVITSNNYFRADVVSQIMKDSIETVEAFNALDLSNPQLRREMSQRLVEISNIASKHGIIFHYDSLAAIYRVGKGLDFVINDMGNLKFDSAQTAESNQSINAKIMSSVIEHIEEVKGTVKTKLINHQVHHSA